MTTCVLQMLFVGCANFNRTLCCVNNTDGFRVNDDCNAKVSTFEAIIILLTGALRLASDSIKMEVSTAEIFQQ
jgi:hypothetical protein